MNAKLIAMLGVTSLATCTLMSQVVVVRPPTVVITTPAPPPPPVVTLTVGVPDDYVWDGTEFVGVVGDQYYYLGPDHIWLAFDAPRLVRFHDWERAHADWRLHAIRNEKYRRDIHGHEVPFRDLHAAPPGHPVYDHGDHGDHGRDGDDHHHH